MKNNNAFPEYCQKHTKNKSFHYDMFEIPWCDICTDELIIYCTKHNKYAPCGDCFKEEDALLFEESIDKLEKIDDFDC